MEKGSVRGSGDSEDENDYDRDIDSWGCDD